MQVLEWLADNTRPDGEMCYGFRPIVRDTGLERKQVRVACRLLKRKGHAEFHTALCDEDGYFHGSGYCISRAGLDAFQNYMDSL
jgi:hypothetical protein